MYLKYVLLSNIIIIVTKAYMYNITDISLCKLSHFGLEFFGTISKTESGARCQNWQTDKPIHKVDKSFTDDLFPERSMQKAKNYCRNPNRNANGPWCYTMSEDLSDETCGIPLCSNIDCKLTGPGMDYMGIHNRGNSGKKCLKWNKHRKKVKVNGKINEQMKFSKRNFPDESRGAAKKYCRNPDGDVGGPWCYVEYDENEYFVEKDYCDVQFCDDQVCMVFTTHSETYTHYTNFNKKLKNLTFSVKLWDSDNIFEAHARLLLTLFPAPLSGEQLNDMNIGIEIYISNNESAMTVGNKDTVDYEPTINILKSSKFTTFNLLWNNGFVQLNLEGQPKPIFLAEYKVKYNLFSVNKDSFLYYSLQGSNVLWALPFCDEDDECEIHTTTSENYERFWPLRRTETGHDLVFSVRAIHSACILLKPSPMLSYPTLKIILSPKSNRTILTLKEYKDAAETTLVDQELLKILDYWEWREFTITFFGQTIQVFVKRDIGLQIILETKHKYISSMRWFSPGSDDCVIHWTFYCEPPLEATPPKPWPPECVLNVKELDYNGTQWITNAGYICLPWTTVSNVNKKIAISNWNYCRDIDKNKAGTYCNAVSVKNGISIRKCELRLCKSTECRMAGTGNDYIGKLSITRSKRTCQKWTVNSPHKVDPRFLNSSLYADQKVEHAENFCRDPNQNVSGPWCYTTDTKVPFDLCNVRDCTKQEECIIMTKGGGVGRKTYILPQWKERGIHGGLFFSLKEWNPDLLDGIIFEITPLTGKGWIQLIIGAENNERVILSYGDDRKTAKVIKEKTLPHLIPAGKWTKFWLQMRKGEIMLGFEGITDSLFEWIQDDKNSAFEPMFMTYMSIEGNIIGVHFRCDECHTEVTKIPKFTRIMPLGMWSKTENVQYNNITFYIRGKGVALIPLMLLPGSGRYYAVAIGDFQTWIYYIWNDKNHTKTLKAINIKETPIEPDKWTSFMLKYSEYKMEVFRNKKLVLSYISKIPMLFYWFSFATEEGYLIWAANCQPPDIDGAPRDGGWSKWSPWTCTVSCGGGTGYRTRTCSNPRPNIYGKLCQGSTTTTGRCNEFLCGDISPKTEDVIREHLKTHKLSLVVDEGMKIVIENDKEVLELIANEAPEAYYEWTLNGLILNAVEDEIDIIDDNVVIQKVNSSDIGIYACMLIRINGKRTIITVVSLAVKSKSSIMTRYSYRFILNSNAVVLGYVYSDLSQKWLINDTIYKDYTITTLAAVSHEYLNPVNYSHSGNWQCIIEQSDLQLSWVTNIVNLQVNKAPTLLIHLMEDEWSRPIFGRFKSESEVLFVLVLIVVSLFVLTGLGLFAYLKWGVMPKRRFGKPAEKETNE